MKNNEFKAPLTQSAAIIGGVILLFLIVASSGAGGSGGGILAAFTGIGKTILFFIGMGISLAVCIAIMIGIFLGAVAMTSPEQAAQMYADLKKNFAVSVASLSSCKSCADDSAAKSQLEEEYNQMKQEITLLQQSNATLLGKLDTLRNDKESLKNSVNDVQKENSELKGRLEELNLTVENLQQSEKSINELIAKLTEKVNQGSDQELKDQLSNLEKMQSAAKEEIEAILERLNNLENGLKQSPTSGIFSYIEDENYQNMFVDKVTEAISQGLTYAQIDEFLTKTLPADLDKIVKDHPALTKNYIRNLRRD